MYVCYMHNRLPSLKDYKSLGMQSLKEAIETLILEGLQTTAVRRSMKPGRAPQTINRQAIHIPVEGSTRRRCTSCSAKKTNPTRTETICKECQSRFAKCALLHITDFRP
ncbi:PREDICTED: uncharacterized protein LOC108361338 [Rhagoletis zephyria]|uniref:uncharacterized protein LOC108361338 n=1 Tax=Rhagoletis zephyria TaxID=28612 RepID=UPI00081142BC|nr:PREDICTED: uncharacterized protein LOC108361338 [Rhagoletis zephyria]